MIYFISDFAKVDKIFKQYFGIGMNNFIDKSFEIYFDGKLKIELSKFENYLNATNIKFSNSNVSILEFINFEYGESAYNLILNLI